MEHFIGSLSVLWLIIIIVLAFLTIMLPVYIYQIKNRAIRIDKKMDTIIKLLKSVSIVLILVLLSIQCVYAKHKHPEKYYQNLWCAEHKTRCDCLTSTHAVEHDFASKWAEAIGQSLHYSAHTGKRAGIVLILESKKDIKYWERLNWTIKACDLPIDTWAIIWQDSR